MLTYSLSKREKALVLVLALVLVAVAWFALVFQRTTDEINSLESQIANADSEIVVNQTRVSQVESMKAAIVEHEAAGERAVEVPAYDNMTPLMGELDNVLSSAETYSVTFDELSIDSASGYVQRGVKVEFGCGSYEAAKEFVNALAKGAFPCVINTVSITDNSVGGASRSPSAGPSVSATLHLTYLEKR